MPQCLVNLMYTVGTYGREGWALSVICRGPIRSYRAPFLDGTIVCCYMGCPFVIMTSCYQIQMNNDVFLLFITRGAIEADW